MDMVDTTRIPSFDELFRDVQAVREAGAGRIRGKHLPALRQACTLIDLADEDSIEPAPIHHLLRSAVDQLGGGSLQETAEYSLGLTQGTALWSSRKRREKAAEAYELTADTFRKKPEKEVLSQVVEAILSICHEGRFRRARVDMENLRHPADSRLAVQWVERFEAYYRIWTPVYALQADIEAAIETYSEEPSDHLPWDPHGEQAYDPMHQALGYGRAALHDYARYHLELKKFLSLHGGMWIFSDGDTERAVIDAIYRIGWHNNLNSEDDSFLRRHLADARHEESDHFWHVIKSFSEGIKIHNQWQEMIREGVGLSTEAEKNSSQAWLTIKACNDYCDLIEADWLKIADWYRPGSKPSRGITGKALYEEYLTKQQIQKSTRPD